MKNKLISNFNDAIFNSVNTLDGPIYKMNDLIDKFKTSNSDSNLKIRKIKIDDLKNWSFDFQNNFIHDSGKFFKLIGLNCNGVKSGILLQDEIGTLGVLCCEIDGIAHFLIQLKKEPGNIVQSQLSPTLQATLSNQNRNHGGSSPEFLDVFQNRNEINVIIEKELPEQGSIYWQKFNKNIILESKYFKEPKNFMWMTLGQIFKFSEIDNSINSCLRSVLSLISYEQSENNNVEIQNKIKLYIEDYSMNCNLENSVIEFLDKNKEKFCFQINSNSFEVAGIEVEIPDREVNQWNQPIIIQSDLVEYAFIKIKFKKNNYFVLNIEQQPGYKNNFVFSPIVITKENFSEVKSRGILSYKNSKVLKELEMSEEGGRFLNLKVKHTFYENLNIKNLKLNENQILVSLSEINKINELGFLSMEGRSMLFFSNFIYNF